MKAVIGILVLAIMVGVAYGLAFLGIIPVAKLAAKSPEAMKVLVSMKLAKPIKAAKVVVANSSAPSTNADDSDQQPTLDEERAQLAQEKIVLARQMRAVPVRPAAAFVPTSDKMVDIYDTMKPEDLAKLFSQMSDPAVSDALEKMDEGKAGKVLVALPVDRSARLTILMNRAAAAPQTTAMAQQPFQSGAPSPVTSVP